MFPTTKSLTFFLISVKMDLENKVIGFQFEPERSISNHEGFYQDSSDEGDAMERDIFDRKGCDPSVWCKCRNCSTMKTEKECLLSRRAVRNFNLQGIFVLSQAIILSELTHNLISLFPFAFVTRSGFRTAAIFKMELFATVANVYKLSSLVAKCSILYFARVPGAASWKIILQYELFHQKALA